MIGIDSTLGELFVASPLIFILSVAVIAAGIYFYLKLRRGVAPAGDETPEGKPVVKTYAQGELSAGTPDETAAALLAIVAEESKIPLGGLKIISITETEKTGGGLSNGKYTFELGEESSGYMKYKITYNDAVYEVAVEGGAAAVTPAAAPPPVSLPKTDAGPGVSIDAPLAGVILDIGVSPGESVKSGQLLCVLEALKMENEILAPYDAVVKAVHIQKGDAVSSGAPMFTIA